MAEIGNRIHEIGLVYSGETVPSLIPKEASLDIGRFLLTSGYKITAGYLIMGASKITVTGVLGEFDAQTRYQKSTRQDLESSRGIIGPYYTISNDEEFCPVGVAIWEPELE